MAALLKTTEQETFFNKPILLQTDNFVPYDRTPWGGDRIIKFFKKDLLPEASKSLKVGESWEVSCDMEYPSRILDSNILLKDLILEYRNEILGTQCVSMDILLKLLNAETNLSVQMHPDDFFNGLKQDECGKPESWYILHAEKGAGIYIGFKKQITNDEFFEILKKGNDISSILQFVPVKSGDYFEIEPGVVHAVGKGVTLLEPQRVLLGKKGLTYRLWDWGRRYKNSILDPLGQPRALHLKECFEILDISKQVGLDFLSSVKKKPTRKLIHQSAFVEIFPKNPHYQMQILDMQKGSIQLSIKNSYAIAIVLDGIFRVADISIVKGQSFVIPQKAFPLNFNTFGSAQLALITVASSEWS